MKTASILLALAGAANGQMIMQTVSIAEQATDFSTTVSVDQFDDQGGTLQLLEVRVELTGTVRGTAGAENQSTTDPVDVDLELTAAFDLSFNSVSIVEVVPVVNSGVITLGTFDGGLDFGGTSGVSFDGDETATEDATYLSTDGGLASFIFQSFIGTGTLDLDLAVDGSFDANATSSSGQTFVTQFSDLFGEGSVKVTYTYIPAPGAIALAGLGGLLAARRRR